MPGGRLDLVGAMNRKNPTSQSSLPAGSTSKSASVSQLEKELKTVREENENLKSQLDETRSVLKQITSEASHEQFDERRLNLLKLQLIQLQRQVLLMSEALGSRSTALMEAENALTWLSETFRCYIGADVKGSDVPVPRSELIRMVETSESARIKLFKNIENCSRENLARPHLFLNPFLKPGEEKEFTILDACLGRTDSLNLRHVAQLESKLSTLYKELIKVSQSLEVKPSASHNPFCDHVTSAARDRAWTVVLRAGAMARECAGDLLSLSLLYPAAPWPPLKKPSVTGVTFESLAPALPTLPRSKGEEVQQCVTAALKACNHRSHMVSQEAAALREELRFHQDVYDLQLSYVQQVLAALRDGYKDFERSTEEVIVQPMKKLMEAYSLLKNTSSEKSLRTFLLIIKENEEQWWNTIQKLETTDVEGNSGSTALSAFGKDFMTSLGHLISVRQTERDRHATNKEELKTAQRQLEEELRNLIQDAEEQRKVTKEIAANCLDEPRKNMEESRVLPPSTDPVSALTSPESQSQQSQTQKQSGKPQRTSYLKKKVLGKTENDRLVQAVVGGISVERQPEARPVPSEPPVRDAMSSHPETPLEDSSDSSSPSQKVIPATDLKKQKPPAATSKAKSQTKRNYEPKLYVANRTLSLRRSGSLTKLNEPTLEEKVRSLSLSRQDRPPTAEPADGR